MFDQNIFDDTLHYTHVRTDLAQFIFSYWRQ